MMMPANYSAVAETEVIYGGAGIGDYLPEIWTSKNVKTLSTNVLTILSNTLVSHVVSATLGTMFGGTWGDDDKLFGSDGSVTALFKYPLMGNGYDSETEMNGLNKFMRVLGVAAAVYTLGTTSAANILEDDDFAMVTEGLAYTS